MMSWLPEAAPGDQPRRPHRPLGISIAKTWTGYVAFKICEIEGNSEKAVTGWSRLPVSNVVNIEIRRLIHL